MNPPFSVVFLTTFIGMAQGCFLALFGEQLREQFSTAPASGNLLSYGAMVVLLLLIAGLAASFFSPRSSRARVACCNHVAHFMVKS